MPSAVVLDEFAVVVALAVDLGEGDLVAGCDQFVGSRGEFFGVVGGRDGQGHVDGRRLKPADHRIQGRGFGVEEGTSDGELASWRLIATVG